jgi:hypothetical protein
LHGVSFAAGITSLVFAVSFTFGAALPVSQVASTLYVPGWSGRLLLSPWNDHHTRSIERVSDLPAAMVSSTGIALVRVSMKCITRLPPAPQVSVTVR